MHFQGCLANRLVTGSTRQSQWFCCFTSRAICENPSIGIAGFNFIPISSPHRCRIDRIPLLDIPDPDSSMYTIPDHGTLEISRPICHSPSLITLHLSRVVHCYNGQRKLRNIKRGVWDRHGGRLHRGNWLHPSLLLLLQPLSRP